MAAPQATIKSIFRYPVKGLSPESLPRVRLEAGKTLPADRRYAIENGPSGFDPAAPSYLPKSRFLMLMRNERLAELDTRYEDATHTLVIRHQDREVARADLSTRDGRLTIEAFFRRFMPAELRGPPKLLHADGHSFSDVAAKCVHIVNLASVRELERVSGRPINPLRFRANLYLDGVAPWAEFGWLDKELRIGPAKLSVLARTSRCEATNVDPATGARDMAIPAHLLRTWGHQDFGIYAKVVNGGEISVGTPVMTA